MIGKKGTCIICGGKTSRKKYKKCIECYKKWQKIPKNNNMFGNKRIDLQKKFKGKGNPNYKSGKSYSNRCIDCNRKITYKAKRCIYCRHKFNVIIKHHIDRDRNNNQKSNLLYLTSSNHRKLHSGGYDYLVKIGLVRNYVKYFKQKYMGGIK